MHSPQLFDLIPDLFKPEIKKPFKKSSERLYFTVVGDDGFEPPTLPTLRSGCSEPAMD